MPTYQYVCTECGEDIEVLQKFTDAALTTHDVCGGKLRKVFSPVGIVFKGSGFYRTDSRGSSSASSSNGSASAEKAEKSSTGKAENADKADKADKSEKADKKADSTTTSKSSSSSSDSSATKVA